MLYQVRKRFSAEGRKLKIGEIVETSHWRNERLLLEHGFLIKPSAPQADAAAVKAGARIDAKTSPGDSSAPKRPAATPAKPTALQSRPYPLKRSRPVVGKVPVAKGTR